MNRQKPSSEEPYTGFEQGPIRPPSEAMSLLVRITRNCPRNRCSFCPVYKTEKFSVRPIEHIKRDIDLIFAYVTLVKEFVNEEGRITTAAVRKAGEHVKEDEWEAFNAAAHWVIAGEMGSVFLQDADSLVIKPAELVDILIHLKKRFPSIRRITSYARSQTIARRKLSDLSAIHEAGLNRIHVGLESGSNRVLEMVEKGVTKEVHIEAGTKVKQAGMELSEYIIPGLGGVVLSEIHALETADTLNRIDPHFIRLRALAIPPHAPLSGTWQSGHFQKCTDLEIAKELRAFIEALDGIESVVKSDHMLNLFMELEGTLPGDKGYMLGILDGFLSLEPEEQRLFQLGRRLGVFRSLEDLANPRRRARVEASYHELGITPKNLDRITDRLMMRFV